MNKNSFIGLSQVLLLKDEIKPLDIDSILINCCHGLNTTPNEVKSFLLTKENIKDILSGDIPYRTLKEHIKVWIDKEKVTLNGI